MMKAFFRNLSLGLFTLLLIIVSIFSCQKKDVNPRQEEAISSKVEFKKSGDTDEVDCEGLKFVGLTNEQLSLLEEIGMEEFWKKFDFEDCKNYSISSKEKFCNYSVYHITVEGDGGLEEGDDFCVSCDIYCETEGIVWNKNGYRAIATLIQTSFDCGKCYQDLILPKGNPPS